jgi:tryptophan halogenase
MEGYLVLLVGQKVPYQARYVPTAEERRIWARIRAEHRVKALTALTVREALDAVLAPAWRWTPGFFRNPAHLATATAQLTSFIGAVAS